MLGFEPDTSRIRNSSAAHSTVTFPQLLVFIFPDEFSATRVPVDVLLLRFVQVMNLKLLIVLKMSRY
jgi:hypothetical protein